MMQREALAVPAVVVLVGMEVGTVARGQQTQVVVVVVLVPLHVQAATVAPVLSL
jgi:hypothetical protein